MKISAFVEIQLIMQKINRAQMKKWKCTYHSIQTKRMLLPFISENINAEPCSYESTYENAYCRFYHYIKKAEQYSRIL